MRTPFIQRTGKSGGVSQTAARVAEELNSLRQVNECSFADNMLRGPLILVKPPRAGDLAGRLRYNAES